MGDICSLKMPGRIYCGVGAIDRIQDMVKGTYKRIALFTDEGVEKAGLLELVERRLKACGVSWETLKDLTPEPAYGQAQKVIDEYQDIHADLIIAVGGGSVMDVAKLASVMDSGRDGVKKLLEDPKCGKKRVKTLMIPTTAGTGAEATPNSIVAVPEKEVKVGIVNEEMISDMVILDGTMTENLPYSIATATGIDALAHAIECYTSNKACEFSNLFAMEALKLIFSNIEAACKEGGDLQAKTNMLRAAFYGGVAITASGTTAVHALSYPLGGKYHIPHGVANAMLLAPVMRWNLDSCQKELAKVCDAVEKTAFEGSEEEKAKRVVRRLEELVKALKIPASLEAYGVTKQDLEQLVDAGMGVKRLLANNRRVMTRKDAEKLYMDIMGEGGG